MAFALRHGLRIGRFRFPARGASIKLLDHTYQHGCRARAFPSHRPDIITASRKRILGRERGRIGDRVCRPARLAEQPIIGARIEADGAVGRLALDAAQRLDAGLDPGNERAGGIVAAALRRGRLRQQEREGGRHQGARHGQSRWNLSSWRCSAWIQRTVPVAERMTTVSVWMTSPQKRTPLSIPPVVTPVAANRQSPRTMSTTS